MMNSRAEIGIIGGSGLYEMAGLEAMEEVQIATPFGDPSDSVVIGTLEGRRIAFLPRHGKGHRLNPTAIPMRANVFALKLLGVKRIISISAVGSLREEIRPQEMVIPDQIIDRTLSGRPNTFYDKGIVVHIAFAEPFCGNVSALLHAEASNLGVTVHKGGIYVAMEGPQFSTIAESNLYRSWGASIIGMTAIPEAKLAREAEICYAVLAAATDYDVWHPEHDSVTADMIIANLGKNTENAKSILRGVVANIPEEQCTCQTSLANSIVTAPELVPWDVKRDLEPLIGKYIGIS